MDTILEYAERAFEPLSAESLTPVDSLILAWTTHFEVAGSVPEVRSDEGAPFGDLLRAENFDAYFPNLWDPEKSRRLLTAMASSPRFRGVRMARVVEQVDCSSESQFAAASYLIGEDLAYIGFRGTDRTLVGWKEDFNMAFQCPVPAQRAAADYVAEVAAATSGRVMVGGHSKGGNLAIYAAALNGKALGDRLVRAFSHDGPGFLAEWSASEDFLAIADRIDKTIPQSSIVGMLLNQSNNVRIVKSQRVGLWQHDPFSWVVEGADFAPVDELTIDARHIDSTLSTWIADHSQAERERFVDTVYGLITSPGVNTIDDLLVGWQKALPAIRSQIGALDPETREFLRFMLRGLAATSWHVLPETLKSVRAPWSAPKAEVGAAETAAGAADEGGAHEGEGGKGA